MSLVINITDTDIAKVIKKLEKKEIEKLFIG